MDIVVHDANELDAIAGGLARAEHDLYWTLKPLEFGHGAVPWQRGTQDQWRRIRNQLNRELGLMAGEARELRDRANRTRSEAFRESFFAAAPSWLSVFAAVPAGIVGFYLGRAVLSAMNAQSVQTVVDPPPPQRQVPPFVIRSEVIARPVSSLMAEKVAAFKAMYPLPAKGGQCVEFVQAFGRSLGLAGGTIGRFGANGAAPTPRAQWENDCPAFQQPWARLEGRVPLRPGDIMFMDWDPVGHVMIVESVSADGKSFTVIDSNYGEPFNNEKVGHRTYTFDHGDIKGKLLGVMRYGG
jgi:hypothetical protein